jgi:hypothetical protein
MKILLALMLFAPTISWGQVQRATMLNFGFGQLQSKNESASLNKLLSANPIKNLPTMFSYSLTFNVPRDSIEYTGQARRWKDGAGGIEYNHFKLSQDDVEFRGYFVGAHYGKDLLRKNYLIDLEGAWGFNWGKRSIIIDDELSRYNNSFFAPKLTVTVRLKMWRIVLFGKIDYQYDITNDSWKWETGAIQNIEGSKFNTLIIYGGIGFNIHKPY